jgi:prepilin-type N-terminal cleavage/methylation domain-containing protein
MKTIRGKGMNQLVQKLQKKQSGFTIIEVMIVLAIAGLIIAVVLVAIPQLQRNQRNEARRSILGRMKTEIDNFSANNNGTIPAAENNGGGNAATEFGDADTDAGFFDRYFDCTGTGVRTCAINVNDPSTGNPMGLVKNGQSTSAQTMSFSADPTSPANDTTIPPGGNLTYRTGRVCDGEVTTTTGANTRNYTLQVSLEGGAIYCLDNR